MLNNYNYTFQDVDAADGYTRVRLSDDGLTAVLTRWNVQSGVNPCTKIINRNGTIVILDGCIANVVSREGSVIAGWCAIHGTDGCRAFRWTKAGLELLPEAATRSIALRIEMDTGYRVIIVGTIEGPLVQGIFHWQDDQVTVSYGHNVNVDTNIDTVSSDGLIFKSSYKKWYSCHLSPMRCDLDRNEEFVDDILKRAKVLDEGWILETVDYVSSNGVFMAGIGAKNGQRRVFVSTVPRSHIAVASNSSFFQKIQNVAVDYAFRAFSGILFKYTKYFPLPI